MRRVFEILTCLMYSGSIIVQAQTGLHNDPRRFAVLVGIDNYRSKNIRRLHGAENDVKAMKSVLLARYGFVEQNIHVLIDSDATYSRIIAEFKTFLFTNATRPDDIVVFHFSGHGSRSPSSDSSGFDETIVPYDSRDPKNLDISSKALTSLLRQLARKTKNITVILDSCNSGRIVNARGLAERGRSIPSAGQPAPPPPFPGGTSRGSAPDQSQFSPLDNSYVLLSATLAKQDAQEYPSDDPRYGVFSYLLTQELQRARVDSSYRTLMDAVQIQVSEREDDQDPQLSGPNQGKQVFGIKQRDDAPYILTISSPGADGQVRFPYAGEAHGITVGSTYDVYPPEAVKFEPPEQPIARVEVNQVGAYSSTGRILSGGPVRDYSRSVLRDFRLVDRKLRVWIQTDPTSTVLSSITQITRSTSSIELSNERDTANLVVTEKNGRVGLSTPDGMPLGTSILSEDPDADRRICLQMLKWVYWFYLLSADNPGSPLDVTLSVSVRAPGSRGPTSSLAQIGKSDTVFKEGDAAEIVVTNKSQRSLYVTVLVLSSDRTISIVPLQGGADGPAVELKPGASLSPSRPPRAFVPSCLPLTKDSFKLIATSKPVNMRPFEQKKGVCDEISARSAQDLQDLMAQPNFATRGFGSDPGDWISVRKVVEVRHR